MINFKKDAQESVEFISCFIVDDEIVKYNLHMECLFYLETGGCEAQSCADCPIRQEIARMVSEECE